MFKSKIVKTFTNKGFKGLLRVSENKAHLVYLSKKGGRVKDFEPYQDELNPIVEKARIYCDANGLTLWSY